VYLVTILVKLVVKLTWNCAIIYSAIRLCIADCSTNVLFEEWRNATGEW